jgi:hypothetical protein
MAPRGAAVPRALLRRERVTGTAGRAEGDGMSAGFWMVAAGSLGGT